MSAAMPQMADTQSAILVENISKRFGRVLALDDISLAVPEGDIFALLGPNGAGKSTLIDILCTITRPDGGRAEVAGVDVVRQPLRARRNLGVVFQETTLDTRLSVRENLDFHGLVYQMGRADRRRRIDEMLELVELSDWREAVVRTLSSGMRRRLEIARALMHQPRILFLDERCARTITSPSWSPPIISRKWKAAIPSASSTTARFWRAAPRTPSRPNTARASSASPRAPRKPTRRCWRAIRAPSRAPRGNC
jgi:ABC-type lipoprotein export system ATPase subunit